MCWFLNIRSNCLSQRRLRCFFNHMRCSEGQACCVLPSRLELELLVQNLCLVVLADEMQTILECRETQSQALRILSTVSTCSHLLDGSSPAAASSSPCDPQMLCYGVRMGLMIAVAVCRILSLVGSDTMSNIRFYHLGQRYAECA